jgi:hypothetical protein
LFSFGSAVEANCLTVNFDNGEKICLELDKSSNYYYANVTSAPSDATLKCDVVLPNDVNESLGACNGYFSYSSSKTETLRLYVWLNNREFKVVDAKYNFSNGTRGSSSDVGGGSSSSDNEEIEITTNKSSPTTSQYVNVTVDTDSSYKGYVYFSVQYRASSSDAWKTQTSSTYFTAGDNYLKNGYKFVTSDYGSHTFSSFIRFNKSGYYRLYVEDADGNEDYVQFSVDTSSSSSNDEIEITTNKSSPTTSQYVNVTVDTDSSYRGEVEFYVQYRASSSDAWKSQTSSTYFTAGDDYLKNGYKFTASDSGRHVFSSFIRFNKSGYYRLYVEDADGNEDYVQFSVDTSSSSSSDEIEISANRTSPTTSQYVTITVDTDSSYRGRVTFEVQYRASSTASWKVQTSSSYFTADDEIEEGYKFTASDSGRHVFSNVIKFNKNGYYRLYVEDNTGESDYVQFNVGSSSNDDKDSSVDGFTVKELGKITKIYKLRKSLIAQFEKESKSLRNSTYWHTLSDNLYQDMKDVINNKKNRDFDDRSDFRSAFLDWFEYTYQNA